MKDLDRRIGEQLAALRDVPVPEVPALRPLAPEPRSVPWAMAAAAAMLVALVGSLYLLPGRAPSPAALLADRIGGLESRIARVESLELRSLLSRELALLRRELELSQLK